MKRKSIVGRVIVWTLLLGLVAALIVLPRMARERVEESSAEVLLSAAAEPGEIVGTLSGGGTLRADESLDVTVPSGVELTEYLISDGDHVTEGTPIASVDKVTVMAAALEVQKTLDELAEKIKAASNDKAEATLTAAAPGRVKALYVKSGDDVRTAMLTHGCLAVISLDGHMSVEFSSQTALTVGTSVRVRTGDKTYTGRVESCLDGTAVVTLTDDGPKLGAAAEVSDKAGTLLGSGTLTVHSPLRVIAESGTVNKVFTKKEAKLAKGAKLLSLKSMEASAEYESLAAQRQEYAEVLQELFALYRDGVVKAPGDGYVIGLDKNLVKELSSDGSGYRIMLLAEETKQFEFFFQGKVKSKEANVCTIEVESIGLPDDLQAMLSLLGIDILTTLNDPQYQVWEKEKITAVMENETSITGITAFEKVSGGEDCRANYVLRISTQNPLNFEIIPQGLTVYVKDPQPQQSPQPSATPGPGVNPSPGASGIPDAGGKGGFSGGFGGFGGGFGGGGAGAATPEPEVLYDLTDTVIGTLVPDNSMKVSFPVDELDILKYSVGMEAEITVDALPGRTYAGTVTEIGNTGVSEGGNSKFTVTVSFDRTGDMLDGMNASVNVRTGKVSGLLLPVAALSDEGSRTYVYTALDKEGKQPAGRTEVTVGASDGEHAQILSGLEEGQTVWYLYYGDRDSGTSDVRR